ncbi:MAG TPA: hypothetical protein PLQ12_08090 [Candidatus Defluviicoccus seviourii]|nr:hypothetical protein [Candidatus Defluviicoccus seviourii]
MSISSKFIWNDIFNRPFINDACRDMACVNQLPQPCRREWINLVVIGRHCSSHGTIPATSLRQVTHWHTSSTSFVSP